MIRALAILSLSGLCVGCGFGEWPETPGCESRLPVLVAARSLGDLRQDPENSERILASVLMHDRTIEQAEATLRRAGFQVTVDSAASNRALLAERLLVCRSPRVSQRYSIELKELGGHIRTGAFSAYGFNPWATDSIDRNNFPLTDK